MAHRDNMHRYLVEEGVPICDDCVWLPSGMKSRQQANSRGRELEANGYLRRGLGTCSRCGKFKTVSVPSGAELPPTRGEPGLERSWHWEGNVQAAVAAYLAEHGWTVISTADTAAKTPGVDIIAVDCEGSDWWITVKGYPDDKPEKKARPATQARHWLAAAMFDVITYRTESPEVRIGVAIPGPFPTYERLLERSAWLRHTAPYTLFVVHSDTSVEVRSPTG